MPLPVLNPPAVLLAAPSASAAAALERLASQASDPLALSAAALLAILVVLVGLFAWRLKGALAAHSRLSALSTRLRQALAVAPDGYYLWDAETGAEACSARLADILRIENAREARFADVRSRIDEAVRAELDSAVAALRGRGVGFDILLPLSPAAGGAARSVRAIGVRAARADGRPAADLVWFRDMSRFVAETARLMTEIERLAAEGEQLRALLAMLPIPAWLRGPDLSLVFCNEAYARALEMEPEAAAASGHELGEGVIENRGRALAERARLTNMPQSESHHIVIGGRRRLLEFVELPLRSAGAGAMAGYAMDFTDLERAQTDLSREIAANANVLEHLPTAIALYGPDRKLKFFNPAYRNLWRLDEAWLRTGPEFGEVLEAQRERRMLPECVDFRAYREERLRQFSSLIEPHEELVHLPNGTTLRMTMAPHAGGGLLFTFDDVTDKLALERSYNTLIAVQRETLDNLYEGVAVFGGDGRVKLSNPAFARIWKLPPEYLQNEPHISELAEATRDFYDAPDEAAWAAAKKDMIAQVIGRSPRSGRLDRRDGSVLEYAAVPLPDGNLLLRYVEATDRYRVEQALRERNQALETASRLKSEFLANVSYELRTPLNSIIGFSEILKNEYFGKLNARQKEYAKSILEASQSLLLLINDIIDLATIEAGYMTLDFEPVDVHGMLVSVLGLTRERARSRDLTMHLDCPANIGTLLGDQRRLRQALLNLISNSIKFTPPGGTITVKARRDSGAILLSVADTGIGVAKEDQEKVFEKFVRGSAGGARQSGAGLGLSLVKSLIELHGGRVTLASAPEAGTEVICHLPIQGIVTRTASAGHA